MTRRFRTILAAIAAAGFALTLLRLGHFSYWLDEVMQVSWQSGDWAFFWKSLRFDAVHPPLDYLLGKFFETLHPSDAARKLLPALWGAGGVYALGALVGRRAGPRPGLCAAALLAMAPYHVRFAQEIRPYSLGLFLLVLALVALDRLLERPGAGRLAALYLACVATAYALYTAALVLAIAGAALLAEDALGDPGGRRRAARRFLAASPLFAAAIAAAYIPWWPVLREAMRRAPFVAAAPPTWARAGRVAAFFAFAPDDGPALSGAGYFFVGLVVAGAWIALASRGTRFLAVWAIGGLGAVEAAYRVHPHFDTARTYLPAGPALTALAALAIAALLARPVTQLAGAATLAAVLVLDGRALADYFRTGRPDWRTVADSLRRDAAPSDRVLVENQHTQLCVGFYLAGPRWLFDAVEGRDPGRSVVVVGGDPSGLARAWRPSARAWLVLAAGPEDRALRRWSSLLPTQAFPAAGGAMVRRLDPIPPPPPAGAPGR